MVGHQQILQMEELAKQQHQQRLHAHSSNHQGLGNDGAQPLNSSVVLNTMEAIERYSDFEQ